MGEPYIRGWSLLSKKTLTLALVLGEISEKVDCKEVCLLMVVDPPVDCTLR